MTRSRPAQMLRVVALRALLVALAAIAAGPVVWAAFGSLKQGRDITTRPFALPRPPTLRNYGTAVEAGLLWQWLHSVLLTSVCVLLVLLLASLASYAFSRLSFRGRAPLRTLLLSGMMVPVHAVLIPLFVAAGRMGLAGSPISLVGPYVAFSLPLSVLLLTTYFAEVPREIEDAARLDGCSDLRFWWHVLIPMARNGLITVGILQGVWIWNEYPMALVMLTRSWKTLPVGLAAFKGQYHADWGAVLAGLVIVAVPLLALFFAFQRWIVRGMTAGAVKS